MAGNGPQPRSAGGNADEGQRRLAVLIDADNAQASVIEGLLAEVARFGVASVKRIYGDFTSTRLQQWKHVLLEHSIQPVQQFAYTSGKNATDSSLIIDAMDLMYTRRFDGFCLVTSDSDFTRLAQRLREEGLLVYGFGEEKTPMAFRQACDTFVHTEVLRPITQAAKPAAPASPTRVARVAKAATSKKPAAVKTAAASPQIAATATAAPAAGPKVQALPLALLRKAIEQGSSESSRWAHLGSVGQYISKVRPDFDARLYGHKKLSDLFRANPKLFAVEERGQGEAKSLYVSLLE
ncbi:MAG: NYN domain-containing protein [Arenimonas sp.]